jgi:hypothetical protein
VHLSPPPLPDDLLEAATEAGTAVRLYLDGEGGAFQTSVLRADGDHLWVAPVFPSQGNLVIERLLPRVRFELIFGGLPHVGTCRVLATAPEGILLERPRSLERVQRRRYFRVPAPAGFSARIQAGENLLQRTVVDISGGGCALRAEPGDDRLTRGQAVDFVHLPVGPPPGLIAGVKVRRHAMRSGPRGPEAILGIEFDALHASERCRLISWVSDQERQQLRRRVLDRPRSTADVIVLLHDSDEEIRLKPGVQLSTSGVTVRVGTADDDLTPGREHPGVELRVGGEQILRARARVERLPEAGDELVFLRFVDLEPAQRLRVTQQLLK